jgi:uncharacterized protein
MLRGTAAPRQRYRLTDFEDFVMSTPSDQIPPPIVSDGSRDDRNIAMLTHLSGFFLSILVPLIVWLMFKDRADKTYVVREAKEALNFQITILIAYVIATVLIIILIGLLLIKLVWVLNLVFCIIAAIRVSSDGSYRYPFALRLVS